MTIPILKKKKKKNSWIITMDFFVHLSHIKVNDIFKQIKQFEHKWLIK